MSLRLPRRRPAAAGRHARAVPGPMVPGAAATLVAAADPWDQPSPGLPEPSATPPDPRTVAAVAVPPVLLTVPTPQSGPEPVGVVAGPAAPDPVPSGVSLGFADGALIDLPADDPRVRTFAAAAAALLEAPRR